MENKTTLTEIRKAVQASGGTFFKCGFYVNANDGYRVNGKLYSKPQLIEAYRLGEIDTRPISVLQEWFIHYNHEQDTLTINPFEGLGCHEDVTGLAIDMLRGLDSCCPLEGSLDAVSDGAIWVCTGVTAAILEDIYHAITAYEDGRNDK